MQSTSAPAATSTTSAHKPDVKAQRYDRQLRLWAANGQKALEETRVCLINGTATGTEILKNLILPGIGSFTVVDGSIVSGSDVGNNFFLTAESIGKSRAECVTHLLKELNDSVRASYECEDPVRIIYTNPDYFRLFEMIIATNLDDASTLRLSEICWSEHIPFVSVKNIGFTGYFRIAVPEHTIIETHPDSIVDLRLDRPFPELETYSDEFNFEEMDGMQHGHIPFVIILLQYVKKWKQEHAGQLPKTIDEKHRFKAAIKSGMRVPNEENFEEAFASSWRAFTTTKIPLSIDSLFNDPACQNLSQNSSNFWLQVRALCDFVKGPGDGLLPLPGSLPDMKADSDGYVRLQRVYKKKALEDFEVMKKILHHHLKELNLPLDSVSHEELETFCKHAGYLKVCRYSSIMNEYSGAAEKEIKTRLDSGDELIQYYIAMRAVERFRSKNVRRFPGEHSLRDVNEDIMTLREITSNLFQEWGIEADKLSQIEGALKIISQAGGAELHNMAALLGGLVAQEVIKLATRQYVPMNNTCIFDGITSSSTVYRM